MKTWFRQVLWFVLQPFERGDKPYTYKPMNRQILIVVGILFGVLTAVSIYFATLAAGLGYLIPVAVFSVVSLVCLIVGLLGSDRAVAKIWGNR